MSYKGLGTDDSRIEYSSWNESDTDAKQDVRLPKGLVTEATYFKGTAVYRCAFSVWGFAQPHIGCPP